MKLFVFAAAALCVSLAGCSAAIDPAAVADAQTAARVKTALVNDPEVGDLAIEVRVVRGVATLSGRVRSQAQIDRAITLAKSAAGVTDVGADLQIMGETTVAPDTPPVSGPAFDIDLLEADSAPGLLAVGASFAWSLPGSSELKQRMSVSPLIKIGSPGGLGPAVAFDWFRADLQSVGTSATLTRVNVRPIMGGVGYTLLADRLSLTPSIVGGVAFNSLTVTDTGIADGLPVEVRNSFAWRVGASAWYDVTRRVAVSISSGYLMTTLPLTVVQGGQLVRRDASGNTTILHAGLAYRLF